MEKWGSVILFLISTYCAATYQPPSSGPSHAIPDSQPYPHRASRVKHSPASETSPSTGDFSKAKANHSPGREKMEYSRRQVVIALNQYVGQKEGQVWSRWGSETEAGIQFLPFQKSETLVMLFWHDLHTARHSGRFQFTLRVSRAFLLGKRASHLY